MNFHRQLSAIKRVMTHIPRFGALCLRYTADLNEFGSWVRSHEILGAPAFETKLRLFEFLAGRIKGEPIDYLEFGVYQGDTMRKWCHSMNRNAGSRFFGFDCFTGLPEAWSFPTGTLQKGTYDAGGLVPQIDDVRVRFIKGLFQDTLPEFLSSYVPQNRLVIHLDADLHSSTLYVLSVLDRLLTRGTLLILDDFTMVTHVFRATADCLRAFRKDCRLIASSGTFYDTVALEMGEPETQHCAAAFWPGKGRC